jgi:hypothetical protein
MLDLIYNCILNLKFIKKIKITCFSSMKIYFSFISRIKTYLKAILIIIKRRTYFHRNTTKNIFKKFIFKIKPQQ